MEVGAAISASDWAKGIVLSVVASLVGGASKLAIRKSWLLQHQTEGEAEEAATMSLNNDSRRRRRRITTRQHSASASSNDGLLSDENAKDTTISTAASTTAGSPLSMDGGQGLEEDLLRADQLQDGRVVRCCCSARNESNDGDDDTVSTLAAVIPTWVPYVLRYSGMLGMSVLNPICCVLAMNYASPSILAPFSGLTLCWVILGSPCINNEQPSLRQILACALIIAGEVVVAVFGDHTNDEGVTIDDVKKSYQEPAFLLYFVGLIAYVALLGYWMKYSPSAVLRRFAWGSCGGSITGAQNFLKDSLTILKDAKQHQEPLPWFFYVFLASAAGTAFVGLLILTACMKRYDATYSAASFVGSFVVSASIMAMAHYNTFAQLEGLANDILYPIGLVVLMIGVYLLVREFAAGNDEEGEGDADEVCLNEEDEKQESEVSF